MNKRLMLAASFCMLTGVACAKIDFGPWPEGKSPQEIGKRVAQRFIDVPHQNFGRPGRPDRITYPEVCTWWGALAFAKASNEEAIKKGLIARFQPLLGPVTLDPEQAKNWDCPDKTDTR